MYAGLMWELWKLKDEEHKEWAYFSYSDKMAGVHVKNIKTLVKNNCFFTEAGVIDLKNTADTVIKYTWNNKNVFEVTPFGGMTFKRGLHMNVVCDDILADPSNELNLSTIDKINTNFREQIYYIPMPWHKFHIRGTPQSNMDFFFDERIQKEFNFKICKAIVDESNGVALWPEWQSFQHLIDERQIIGFNSFMKEKMCMPIRSVNSYLDEVTLRSRVNNGLINYTKINYPKTNRMIAGWDLGKTVHPSYYTVFEVVPLNKTYDLGSEKLLIKNRYIQRLVKWFDNVDYIQQVPVIQYFNNLLGVDRVYFDNTRGEMTTYIENGTLGGKFRPVNSAMAKFSRPTCLKQIVNTNNIELINDERQIMVMLAVDRDLNIQETRFDGKLNHGDSFVGCMLAVSGGEEEKDYFMVFA